MKLERIDENRLLMKKEEGMNVDALIYLNDKIKLEDEAIGQLRNATKLPPVKKVVGTPDIHSGYGVPIGSVVGLKEYISPAAVGYDINCGMRLIATPLERGEVDVETVAHSISRDIPLGEGMRNVKLSREQIEKVLNDGVRGLQQVIHDTSLEKFYTKAEYNDDIQRMEDCGSMAGDAGCVSGRAIERGKDQLGTLGGGNHFIEIQMVKNIGNEALAKQFGLFEGQIVVMIHSGSRGMGHQTGDDYMPLAAEMSKDIIPSRQLGIFSVNSKEGQRYISAMRACANFAFANRQAMTMLIRKNFRHYFHNIEMPLIYDVTHNMAKLEVHSGDEIWVHRKGATRAFPGNMMNGTPFNNIGQPVLIPGSMGTASYLLVGLEQAKESLFSVNHGAGRVMSRSAAAGKMKRSGQVISSGRITDDQFKRSMKGVHLICRDQHSIKEEAPDAYKDIDEVINVVTGAGLACIVARMVPLAVLKG